MDKEKCVPTNTKMEQNSRQPSGSMFCYNTTVFNIMSNRTGLKARRKEDQNSPVALLQGLFAHSKHISFSCRTFQNVYPTVQPAVEIWHHETA
jgi:hypothetical protein